MNSEGSGNGGILKLWLAKLTPLVYDKNTKLKDAAVKCIISVYSHFDSVAVLNYILSLSVEEQNSLRRSLKQKTPRIEVDLMNFVQNKKERQRPKSSYDPSDVVGTSSEEGYIGISRQNHLFGRYSGGSIDSDGGRKWSSAQESMPVTGSIGQDVSDQTQEHLYLGLGAGVNSEVLSTKTKDLKYTASSMDSSVNLEASSTPRLDVNGLMRYDNQSVTVGIKHDNDAPTELDLNHSKLVALKINSTPDIGLSIPQLLHLVSSLL